LWDSKWQPPADAHQGIPRFPQLAEPSGDMWPWLALAGGLGLLAEWLLYGRFRRGFGRRTLTMRPRVSETARLRR